ncbi:MAG: hypothetical protein K6A82_08000 [Prevotella sp.]|nr:hypothetical protein [Prevotella sp.]
MMTSRTIQVAIIIATGILAVARIIYSHSDIILHWDLAGNITDYGPRYIILLLPIISILLFLLLKSQEKNPYGINKIKRIRRSEKNQEILVHYRRRTSIVVLLLILYITACAAQFIALHNIFTFGFIAIILLLYIQMYRTIER